MSLYSLIMVTHIVAVEAVHVHAGRMFVQFCGPGTEVVGFLAV